MAFSSNIFVADILLRVLLCACWNKQMYLIVRKEITWLKNGWQAEDVNKVLGDCGSSATAFFPPICSVPTVQTHARFPHSAPILYLESPVISSHIGHLPVFTYTNTSVDELPSF